MNGRRRTGLLIFLIALLSLALAACEMPSPSVGDVQTIPDSELVESTGDGEGTTGEGSESGYPAPEDTVAEVEPTVEPPEDAGASGEPATTEGEAAPTAESPRAEEPAATPEAESSDAAAAPTAEAPAAEATEPAAEAAAEEPAGAAIPADGIHIVQPGETLYQIGLKYGYSWVVLAQYNNLFNANAIQAGQELRIPPRPGSQPDPLPTPVPNTTDETLHTVRPGENLFLIGLIYGIDWPQIAEANGLVNPNRILVGQTLKIPANKPGDAPEFTHIVQPGETLFLISLRYGVTWPAIAEKNNLGSPYVIYPNQTLIIPAKQ